MLISSAINELGRFFDRKGRRKLGDRAYAFASRLAPRWSAPWFNRGISAKMHRQWEECRRFNLRATDLEPSFSPAWWNLGIAATALSDWPLARQAWERYGVEIPPGDGPLDLNLGPVPIRLAPQAAAEVVWCHRIDPARAIVESVPLPDSDRAFGDVVLHDGEPVGHRLLRGREVPVFNELELLTPSKFHTYRVHVVVPNSDAALELEKAAIPGRVAIEDWTTIRILCVACSEGKPHTHDSSDANGCSHVWQPERTFGIAALTQAAAEECLQSWVKAGAGRDIGVLECVFSRG